MSATTTHTQVTHFRRINTSCSKCMTNKLTHKNKQKRTVQRMARVPLHAEPETRPIPHVPPQDLPQDLVDAAHVRADLLHSVMQQSWMGAHPNVGCTKHIHQALHQATKRVERCVKRLHVHVTCQPRAFILPCLLRVFSFSLVVGCCPLAIIHWWLLMSYLGSETCVWHTSTRLSIRRPRGWNVVSNACTCTSRVSQEHPFCHACSVCVCCCFFIHGGLLSTNYYMLMVTDELLGWWSTCLMQAVNNNNGPHQDQTGFMIIYPLSV